MIRDRMTTVRFSITDKMIRLGIEQVRSIFSIILTDPTKFIEEIVFPLFGEVLYLMWILSRYLRCDAVLIIICPFSIATHIMRQ